MSAIELGDTIGALELSVLFSCGFMGMLTVQTYVYYRNFVNDAVWIKLWVAILWSFELGHLISIAHSLYAVTITGWGNQQALVRFIGLSVSPILAGVVSTMVQLFFSRRIQVMGAPYIAGICYLLTILRFLASTATGIIGITYHAIVPFLKDWGWLMTTYISLGAAIDMLIPICLCWKLRQSRQVSISTTASMIDRLMLWTIQTGLTTGLLSFVVVILFHVEKNNFIWIAVYFNVTRLYSNSLLLSLNARASLRQMNTVTILNSDTTKSHRGPVVGNSLINIEMERVTHTDSEAATVYGRDRQLETKHAIDI